MLAVLILFFVSAGFGAMLIGISFYFGEKDKNPTKAKKDPYECGMKTPPSSVTSIPVSFYLTAILFIIFDIEIIFLYPFAIAYREFLSSPSGVFALIGMGIFLSLFIFGLWWEIRSKALEWK